MHVAVQALYITNSLLTLLLLLLLIHVQYDRYTDLRSVRGEGNCYYRAVAFAAIEHLIVHGNEDKLQDITVAFTQVDYRNEYHNEAHNRLIECLRRVCSGFGWFADVTTDSAAAAQQFADDMADTKNTTDGALVRVCKELAAQELLRRRSEKLKPEHEQTLEDYVLFSNGMAIEEVCTYCYTHCYCTKTAVTLPLSVLLYTDKAHTIAQLMYYYSSTITRTSLLSCVLLHIHSEA
jgi:Peptidase C65 Otubain